MSLRTSDRRHWCGSPPVGWKQLGFTAKMFENPGDCARRKYPWGTTPACALVRNDRAFSNSPNYFQEVISCLIEGTDSAMLFDSGMGIDMQYGHDCYPFEGFSIVLSGYP